MRLGLISDLHLDFHKDGGKSFIDSLTFPENLTGLCMAGDVGEFCFLEHYKSFIMLLRAKLPLTVPIYHVAGNHEFFQSDPISVSNGIKTLEIEVDNFHNLDNQLLYLPNSTKRILGGTMWFPFQDTNCEYKKYMNDFSQIKHFVPWVYNKHQEFNKFIQNNCNEGDVILTHHSPHICSSEPRYFFSQLNRFFVVPQWQLMKEKKPALWLHGHVHNYADNIVEGCRIVCNAVGYPFEMHDNIDLKIIEIE